MPQEPAHRRPVQLHVIHDLGGGSTKWLADYCRADTSRANLVLRSFSHDSAMGTGVAIYADAFAEVPVKAWTFTRKIPAATAVHPEYRAALDEVLRTFGVQALVVSSVIGHSLEVLDTGLPTIMVCHDYFPWCPAINLYYDGVCGHCDAARVAACEGGNPEFNPFADFPPQDRVAVRERFVELVASGRVQVVAPSDSVGRNLKRLEPRFANLAISTVAHGYGEPLPHVDLGALGRDERLRILVMGQLSVAKGVKVLQEALPRITPFADVFLLGPRELGEYFKYERHVHVTSDYELAQLPRHVAAIRPHVALLTSIVSETFGYALSELWMLGIPAAATKVGAFPERIQHGVNGYLYEPNAAAMVATVAAIDADRGSLARMREGLKGYRHRSAQEMVADYHRLVPLAVPDAPAVAPSPAPAGQAEAALAVTVASMWKQVRSLNLQMAILGEARRRSEDEWRQERRDMQDQLAQLRVEVAKRQAVLSHKETQIQDVGRRLQVEGAKIAEIYGSTSWRLTRPIRWMGTTFPKIRKTIRRWVRGTDADSNAVPTNLSPNEVRSLAWKNYRETFVRDVRPRLVQRLRELPRRPLISVVVPTFNPDNDMLRNMLDSVRAQIYPEWELCIADDASSVPHVKVTLQEYAEHDARIKVSFADDNRGVATASNRALAMASGEFIVLLDHDDVLEEQALFRVAECIAEDDPDMLYSDEALVSPDGSTVLRYALRPAFSLEYLRSHPYIVHMVAFRASLLRTLGGWNEKLAISHDYDLILRAAEAAKKIVHIPEVLYRWRIHGSSAGIMKQGQVMEASKGVLTRHLERSGVAGRVEDGPSFNLFAVRYPLRPGLRVAIVIPTKNHGELLRQCIQGIRATVKDVAYDIVVVDHESHERETLDYLATLAGTATVLRYAGPFNFAAINNWAVKQVPGPYTHYLLCNNDVEPYEEGWLERMLEVGQQDDVGMVGAKLFYPDRQTIQHAGVCIGLFGAAEHYGKRVQFPDETLEAGFGELLSLSHEVAAVTAACVLIDVEAWNEVGGFDESIAVGFGDVDLCLRINSAGWRIVFCPHARLVHHESFTRGTHEIDPHPVDTQRFLGKWKELLEAGDPYYSPGLSLTSSRWEIRQPIPCYPYVRRRVVQRGAIAGVRERVSFSPALDSQSP